MHDLCKVPTLDR